MKMIVRSLVIAIILAGLFTEDIRAQQFVHNYSIQGHYGTIIPHNKILEPFGNCNPAGINLEYSRLYTSENAWQLCDCFYRTGGSLSWYHFDNRQELGYSVNLRLFFEPLIAPQNKLYPSIRLGTGFAYVSKVYDEETNPRNYFFSMPLTFPLLAGVFLHYKLLEDWELKAGGYFNHLSNGGMKQPNKGMNFPTISAGVVYNPADNLPTDYQPRITHKIGAFELNFRAGTNIKVKSASDEHPQKACWVTGLYGATSQYLTKRMGLTGGFEFIIDGYQKEAIRRKGLDDYPHRIGVLLGLNLEMGRFSFAPKLGFYALLPNNVYDHFYQRYDLTYQLTPHIHTGVYMNAVMNVAEFMGFSIGFNTMTKDGD